MISLQNVSKTYRMGGEDIFALSGINLDIGAGEFIAIAGPSGSGKSTLLNIIGGLDRPTEGEISVEGNRLDTLSDCAISEYRNQSVGFIFQIFNLEPSFSALDNVALPLLFSGVKRRERQRIAKDLLAWVGLSDRIRHRPSELSGGQRQRVAIARALVNRPRIILADEPTGNLDSATSQYILEILTGINKQLGVNLLLVTHDLEAARIADQVYQLQDGRLLI